MRERRLVVFLSHGDETSLRLAGSCALAAAAMGSRVDVFLFGAAVPAVVSAGADADEPGGLLHRARAAGCRLIACSASVVTERVDPQAAEHALDAVVGWPTVLAWSEGVIERFSF
jgi:predicted peroxiredoxin